MYIKSLTKQKRKIQLFCFPYAGGSSSIYFNWRDTISGDIEILTVELPARGSLFLEEPIVDMSILIDRLYQEILPYLNRPFALFGHSMGGVIAYALLKKIEQESIYRAEFLVISASKPPFEYYNSSDYLLSNQSLKDKLAKHNGTPKEVLENRELMDLIVPIYRADLELISRYNPSKTPKLQSRLYLFNSPKDMPKERIMAWSEYFIEEVEYYEFDGGHLFINSHQDKIIELLSQFATRNRD